MVFVLGFGRLATASLTFLPKKKRKTITLSTQVRCLTQFTFIRQVPDLSTRNLDNQGLKQFNYNFPDLPNLSISTTGTTVTALIPLRAP
jgi:hypothetical protein